MKRFLIGATLAVALALTSSPADALNVTRGGGGCKHWVNTTNDRGWPIEYCARWR